MVSFAGNPAMKDFIKHLVAILVAEAILGVLVWGGRSWLNSAVPWMFGSDVVVAGNWETHWQKNGQPEELHETAELKQFGHRVWGTAKTLAGVPRTYELEGHDLSNMLVLTYHEVGPNAFDTGAILLKILNGGEDMEGEEIGQDLTKVNSIVTAKYRWKLRP
jgi:hypothetical protein